MHHIRARNARNDFGAVAVQFLWSAYRGTAPEWRIWTEISQKFDLNFIGLPDDLLAKLAQKGEQERGIIPVGT